MTLVTWWRAPCYSQKTTFCASLRPTLSNFRRAWKNGGAFLRQPFNKWFAVRGDANGYYKGYGINFQKHVQRWSLKVARGGFLYRRAILQWISPPRRTCPDVS
jgi:hypothetical protein